MKHLPALISTVVLSLCIVSQAQTPAGAPAGSTGQCNDGTYSQNASKKGACRGHQGVKTWFAAENSPSPAQASGKAGSPKNQPSSGAQSSSAAAPPAGANGQCNDGSYSTDASKKGACRGHQGVKAWFSGEKTSAATPVQSSASTQSSSTQTPASASASTTAPATSPANRPNRVSSSGTPASTTQAPGGGNGQVWVNTSTNVYHCPGDRYYGKTKQGAYMSESDAKGKGARPDLGKPCTK